MKKGRLGIFYILVVVATLASNFAHPVTPTLIKDLKLHDYMFGVAFAGMSFTNFLFSPFWGKVGRMRSSRFVIAVGFIGYGAAQLFFAHATTELGILLARCLAGIFIGGEAVCVWTYAINVAEPGQQGKNLAVCTALITVSTAFGYLIGGLLGEISIMTAFYVQSATLIISGILFYVLLTDDCEERITLTSGELLREANPFSAFLDARKFMTPTILLLFVAIFFANCGTNSYDQCFNYFIKDQFGFSPSYNGLIKAIVGFIALISNFTICMHLLKKPNIAKSSALILGMCGITMLGVVVIPGMVPFIAVVLLFNVANSIYVPLLQDCAANCGGRNDSSMMMGFYNAVKSLGMIFGALVAGFIYDLWPKSPFALAFVLFTLAALLQLRYAKKIQQHA